MGQYYDHTSDIYSFGVVIYEIFSRILPYTDVESLLSVSELQVSPEQIDSQEKIDNYLSKGYQLTQNGTLVLAEFKSLEAKDQICEVFIIFELKTFKFGLINNV